VPNEGDTSEAGELGQVSGHTLYTKYLPFMTNNDEGRMRALSLYLHLKEREREREMDVRRYYCTSTVQ
jgi:hypothetical protein